MSVTYRIQNANVEPACYMSRTVLRNGLVFALCFYGVLGVIAGLIWGSDRRKAGRVRLSVLPRRPQRRVFWVLANRGSGYRYRNRAGMEYNGHLCGGDRVNGAVGRNAPAL